MGVTEEERGGGGTNDQRPPALPGAASDGPPPTSRIRPALGPGQPEGTPVANGAAFPDSTPERLRGNLSDTARPEHSSDSGPYVETPRGIEWRRRTGQGEELVVLTNFTARIVGDLLHDDGVETERYMDVSATLKGQGFQFTIPASKFPCMNWPAERLGPEAILFPGYATRDRARVAIQLLSGSVPKRHVFTHTGWRLVGEDWIYLHAGGAIGRAGVVDGVEVELTEALREYRLPSPPKGQKLTAAIRSTLSLLDLGPNHVMIPILGAVFRAPLGEADFSLHLAGPTGVFKTELAALAQQFWGEKLDARHLPASWAGTGNSLEALAFVAKDALLVVDDFAPTGSINDARRLHRDADRLLRAQGNRAGRSRMRQDTTLAPVRPPRGVILSTGEEVPNGQSLRARMWVLELEQDSIRVDRLTDAQADAANGVFSSAMSAYIRWLSRRMDIVRRNLGSQVRDFQAGMCIPNSHRRAPEIFANLAIAWTHFLAFADLQGAISREEKAVLDDRIASGLRIAAAEQSYHFTASDPTARFLNLVSAALASGRAHLTSISGGEPECSEASGWRPEGSGVPGSVPRQMRPMGELVGWVDGEQVFLEPESAFAMAQRLARDQGEELTVGSKTLHKRLAEKGLLASTDEDRKTLTVRRTLAGLRRNVLHLRRSALIGEKPAQSAQPLPGLNADGDSGP